MNEGTDVMALQAPSTSGRTINSVPRRLLAVVAVVAVVAIATGAAWQIAGRGHHAARIVDPSTRTAIQPAAPGTSGAVGDQRFDIPSNATPLEAYPNGCPCDAGTGFPIDVLSANPVPLEAFPDGCLCTTETAGARYAVTGNPVPLEAFPNGCPCESNTAVAPASFALTPMAQPEEIPGFRLEEFPDGCPCVRGR